MRRIFTYLTVATAVTACAFGVLRIGQKQVVNVWNNHINSEIAELKSISTQTISKFEKIYLGIQTISLLPSVRRSVGVEREITEDSRANIQQIYNNLKNQLDVSEIYILPENFNPVRIDPQTGKLQQPLASFDQLILHGGKYADLANPFAIKKELLDTEEHEEVEEEEYDVMVEQLTQFRKLGPNTSNKFALEIPMLSSKQITTRDNSVFNKTLIEADRAGYVFSVPVYGIDGEFRGMVSAIVRADVVAGFATSEGLEIFSPFVANSIGLESSHHSPFSPSIGNPPIFNGT